MKILAGLTQLNEYGNQLQHSADKETKDKGKLLSSHTDSLTKLIIIMEAPKLDSSFQEQFLQELHKNDPKYDKHRDNYIKTSLINIAFFILGGGIFYAAAVGIHYVTTGRGLFFSRTHSREGIDQLEKDALQHSQTISAV